MSDYSNWRAGSGMLAVHRHLMRHKHIGKNRETARIVLTVYRRIHQAYYRPLIHKGGKP